jgi:hemolysin activation/secretion protein
MSVQATFRYLAAVSLAVLLPSAAYGFQSQADDADASIEDEQDRERNRREQPVQPPPVLANAAPAAVALGDPVTVGAIQVDGASELPPSAFAPVIARYAGRTLAPDDLRALATDVADVAREAGYGLASAWIPQQTITNGLLHVTVDEGRIHGVEAKGSARGIVEGALASLADGRPIKTRRLERELLLAGDIAGVWVGKARLDRRSGRNILVVDTSRERTATRLYLDNWGTSAVGPVRARAVQDFHGLLGGNDRITLGGVITPFQPKEFGLLRFGFMNGIGGSGTELIGDFYYSYSHPGGDLSDRDIDGRSIDAEIGISHPIVRSRAASLWGDIKLGLRDAEQSRLDAPARDDRIATASGGAYTIADLGGGRVRSRLGFTQGLNVFDATEAGDPLASRADGSAIFSKLELWGQYERPLGGSFSLLASAEGQLASRPLLSSEEMGLGGRYFLRGYDYREFSGDKGIAGSVELRFDLEALPDPISGGQLYVYGDAGSVGNYRDGGGGGSLSSAGGGVRFWLDRKIEANVELGVPLSDGFDGSRPDPRLSFTLGTRL